MVAVPAEASDHEVNTGTRKEKQDKNKSSLTRCDYTSQFVSETHYWVLVGRKTKTIRHPRENYSLFLLTRLIDALERLAHATTNKGTVKASPLQAVVRRRAGTDLLELICNQDSSLSTDRSLAVLTYDTAT